MVFKVIDNTNGSAVSHFANLADALEFVLTLDMYADLFEIDGVMTYRGYRPSIPTDGARISYYRPERHARKPRVLQAGETVNLSELARMR